MIKRLTLILTLFIFSLTVWCQVTVTGIVISSDDNEPLPGVNVVENGTTNGTVTQDNGTFSLTVAGNNSILTFSFIGYVMQDRSIKGRDNLKITLKPDCNRDWFDSQKIGIYVTSGVINNPIGGQFYFAFPTYFGRGTVTTGVSYQTDLDKNRFVNGQVELKHFIYDCDFDMDAGVFYGKVNYENDFHSNAYSVDATFNFRRINFITGYSNLNFDNIETNNRHNYSGALIGIGTWIGGPLRLSITGKAAIYKDHQEYMGQILRDSKYVDVFAKFYKLDSFTELSLGIGTTFSYRFKRQRR